MPIDNEILSPVPIWIWVDPKTKLKHLTGGYGQPDMKSQPRKLRPRPVKQRCVPYKEGKDYQQYCLSVKYAQIRSLEYKIIAAVDTPVKGKTLGSEIIAGQLTVGHHLLNLTKPSNLKLLKSKTWQDSTTQEI